MTDEERQKLVADLRQIAPDLLWSRAAYACNDAADEIERLASIVADYKMTFGDIHEVMGAGITHEATHIDTENGEKSNAESAN